MEDKHVKFDEAVIAEHDKLRGTRQKIDEPDTPYHRGSFDDSGESGDEGSMLKHVGEGSEVFAEGTAAAPTSASQAAPGGATAAVGLDMSALQAKLGDAKSQGAQPTAAHAAASGDFASKRKQHYNEYVMLRKWREQNKQEDE